MELLGSGDQVSANIQLDKTLDTPRVQGCASLTAERPQQCAGGDRGASLDFRYNPETGRLLIKIANPLSFKMSPAALKPAESRFQLIDEAKMSELELVLELFPRVLNGLPMLTGKAKLLDKATGHEAYQGSVVMSVAEKRVEVVVDPRVVDHT